MPKLGVPVVKITIPSWEVQSIRDCLEICGIVETIVFPDLDGLGRLLSPYAAEAQEKLPHEGTYTRLGPSEIDRGGVGVFALTNIKAGTHLFVGDLDEMRWLKKSILPRGPKAVRKLYDDFAVIKTNRGVTRYGCPVNFNRLTVSWYLNHSQSPNTMCDDALNFSALRDIKAGEELTVDYSSYSERPSLEVNDWWQNGRKKVKTGAKAASIYKGSNSTRIEIYLCPHGK